MITFKYRSNSKRINIRTSKKLDQRMSNWLQKVFGMKNQIIGFKSVENKYYDVETFYLLIEKFYNSQVQIVEGSDQVEISFTSDNLNSSSFIRPNLQNNDEPIRGSQDQEVTIITDKPSFERKLTDAKELNILFDIIPSYKKAVIDGMTELGFNVQGIKIKTFIMLNGSFTKKSCMSIYMGKTLIVTVPATKQFKNLIIGAAGKAKNISGTFQQSKAVRRPQQDDQAPSFTTYHLQERLNQQACLDYLQRMSREKLLTSYELHKLVEKAEDNFSDFYKIFCDGVMDNDYQSFKQQIRGKVENNLQMILSNVDQMDLSRPISRQQPRRNNLKKSVPEIQIVKVENYFEVLDLIKERIDQKYLGEIKQSLLDQNEQLCSYFSKFLARQIGKEELARKLSNFAGQRAEDLRPFSRCVPRSNNRVKSSDYVGKEEYRDELDVQLPEPKPDIAPMFGLLSIPNNQQVSPIKNMSDIESNYRRAQQQLTAKISQFSPEEYGLLYHFLQHRDDSISNLIQSLHEKQHDTISNLRQFLRDRFLQVLEQNFTEQQISYIQLVRANQNYNIIFENFKYQCDLGMFLSSLREQLNKRPQVQRILHKKSSDSQLLEYKGAKQTQIRKYSDEKPQEQIFSPSPKASDLSLYQKGSDLSLYHLRTLTCPWADQFEQLLQFCNFQEKQKEEYLRLSYQQCNPSLFLWVRQYLRNKQTNAHDADYFRQRMQKKQYDNHSIMRIVPIFSELLKELENQGKVTFKMRKWAVFSFMEPSLTLIGAFEAYLQDKDEQELIQTLVLTFQNQQNDMEYYRTYLARTQQILKEMVVHDEASLQLFKYYPEAIRSFLDLFYFNGDFEDLMDSLDVLQNHHRKSRIITVSTLNFSGINTNPTEYDDGSQLLAALNANVKELLEKQLPGLQEWNVGKIDKNYTSTDRLSVGFNNHPDTINGRLLNKEEFNQIWREKWDKNQLRTQMPMPPSQQQLSNCIEMDYIFYRATIRKVYELTSFEQLQNRLKDLDPSVMFNYLEKMFNHPASKVDVKAGLVFQYLFKQNPDVFCLQQAGSFDWSKQLVKQYGYLKHHDSVIFYRKSKMGQIRSDLTEKYMKELDFNGDTAFIFTDKHYLIISAHLNSGKKHYEQAQSMFQTLRNLKQQHPLLKIIIGTDSNHFIKHENLLNQNNQQVFFLVPDVPEKPTTVKKRSWLQAQFKKSGVAVSEVKDHIIASSPVGQYVIERIDGQQSSDQLLPNRIHPYDHYVVRTTVSFL